MISSPNKENDKLSNCEKIIKNPSDSTENITKLKKEEPTNTTNEVNGKSGNGVKRKVDDDKVRINLKKKTNFLFF